MRIHIYHDQQVEERVSRRFETYGASARSQTSDDSNLYQNGDPYVQARATDVYFQSVSRNRITLEILERELTSLGAAKGRKSVILVSEGFIYDPNLDEFKDAVQASRRGNAAMYFLDARGLTGMPTYFTAEFGPPIDTRDIGAVFLDNLQEAEGAESLASDSGGFSVKNSNDLGRGIQRIADESRSYYLLGYNSSNMARDGRFHKISVKIPGKKGLTIRARKGYFSPLDGKEKSKKPETADPAIQAALDSPYQEQGVPIRTTSYVFDETLLGKASALIAADVDVSKFAYLEKDGRFQDTLDFLIVVAHRETGEFFRYDQKIEMNLMPATKERLAAQWFPVVRDFELAPGGYQAKIVVRDKNSGKIGTVIHEFEVADLSQFRTSTPVITDTLQPDQEKKDAPRPAIIVRRTFAPGATLFASFEVYGATKEKPTGMPKVTAGYTVRRPDGTAVVEVAPSRINPTRQQFPDRGTRVAAEATGDLGPRRAWGRIRQPGSERSRSRRARPVGAAALTGEACPPGLRCGGGGLRGRRGRDGGRRRGAGGHGLDRGGSGRGGRRRGAVHAVEDRALVRPQHGQGQAGHHEEPGQDRGGPRQDVRGASRPESGLGAPSSERAGQVLALALLEQDHADQEQAGDDVEEQDQVVGDVHAFAIQKGGPTRARAKRLV